MIELSTPRRLHVPSATLRAAVLTGVLVVGALAGPATAEPAGLSHAAMWLAERVGSPIVSPDGETAVFSVTEPAYDPESQRSDLWIVATDGATPPRRLTEADGSEGGVAWSPDGRWLAFVAKRGDQETSQIWVLPLADGGEARPVTDAPLGADTPRWSPDGTRILFHTRGFPGSVGDSENREAAKKRDDEPSALHAYEHFPIRRWDRWLDETRPRLGVVDVARALRHRPTDAPELLARAEAETAEDDPVDGAENAEDDDAGDDGETDEGTEADPSRLPPSLDLIGASDLAKQVGFQGTWGRRSDSLSGIWTPDGTAVVFVATDRGHAAARETVQPTLWTVDAAGGEPRRLTAEGLGVGSPAFSHDGSRLCFTAADYRDVIYDQTEVACLPWPGEEAPAEPTVLTADFDRVVSDFAFARVEPAGDGVAFTYLDAGHVHVAHVGFDGGEVRDVVRAASGVYGGLATASGDVGGPILATWGSATRPTEVVRIDPRDGTRRPLTDFNASDWERWDLPPLREFWTDGPGGRRLHSFLALPPGFDESRKYPVVALIHGGHASMWRDAIHLRWNYHLLAQPDFVLVGTDYRGSIGYGEEFTLSIAGDPLRGPAEDVIAGVEDAIARFDFLDGERVCAAGASYGGHLANWLAGTSDRFDCLVSHAGLASLEQQWTTSDVIHHREIMMGGPFWENPEAWLDQSPLMHAGGMDVPTLMSIGVDDYRVPLGNTLAMWSALERMDAPNRLLVWPRSNHWIMHPRDNLRFYREVRRWLGEWLHPKH